MTRINLKYIETIGRNGGREMPQLLFPSPQERVILDNLLNAAYWVDKERRITYWNEAAEDISGFSAEDVLGKSCKDNILVHMQATKKLCGAHCPMSEAMRNLGTVTVFVNMRHKHGYRIPAQMRCLPLRDGDGNLRGAMGLFERAYSEKDVFARLEELGQIAHIDALTELPNRRYMQKILDDSLFGLRQKKRNFAVVMGDIDFFKKVNDSYGHESGDAVLKEVAETLRSKLRVTDAICRWGGEEFLMLLRDVRPDKLAEKLDSLRSEIESLVVETAKGPVRVTISFGCTAAMEQDTVPQLLERADACLYRSKKEGRNRITFD